MYVVVSSLARMVCFFFSIFANMIVFVRSVVCLLDEYSLSVHKRTVLEKNSLSKIDKGRGNRLGNSRGKNLETRFL